MPRAVDTCSDGNLNDTTGTTSPISGSGVDDPAEGLYHVITDQTGPRSYSLTQSFLASASMVLSLEFAAQGIGGFSDTGDLDYRGVPNQDARVDILTGLAGAFDMGAAIVQTPIGPVANVPPPEPFLPCVFALNSLTVDETYQVRFAQVDNQGFFRMGVVSVELTAAPIPVPAAGPLLLSAVGGMGLAARRRSSA